MESFRKPEPKPSDFPPPQWEWGKTQWNLTVNGRQSTSVTTPTQAIATQKCFTSDHALPDGKYPRLRRKGQDQSRRRRNQILPPRTNGFDQYQQFREFQRNIWAGGIFQPGRWTMGLHTAKLQPECRDKFGPVFLQMPCTDMPLSGNVDIVGAAIVKSWSS